MDSIILYGFLGSLVAGVATAVGALPIFFGRGMSRKASDVLLGFSAGVMLAASFFSLLIPGIEIAEAQFGGRAAAAGVAVIASLMGFAFVLGLNEALPHEHFQKGYEGPAEEKAALAKVWLFVIAITIHNFPEGLSIGVGFGTGDIKDGLALMTGISLQDIPEGLAVAVALVGRGYDRRKAFFVAAMTGAVEPVAGLLGATAVAVASTLLPWGLCFAAGAMLYVISHEIIPETHRHGHERLATVGLAVGLALMMFLDVALG
ncbi:MAG: ZIP family metal transporter [Alphaproteobacteria bacterium]|nr:MAG: ZIP family metal transporter [Alphaproteobacteria bacterium]